ncbi:hypothetical protein [Psychroserpens sp.]|uniref:hypothetical protein n=1 Tax=Psychroserpens sp. TaxID=2020870 RepID=UPI003C77F95F
MRNSKVNTLVKKLLRYVMILAITVLYNCNNDDDSNTNPTQLTSNEIIAALTNSGNSKTWKIESATLTNEVLTDANITTNFNIQDDEFLFSSETDEAITLSHRGRYDFNAVASTIQASLSNNYKSPEQHEFVLSLTSNNQLSNETTNFTFNVINENLINGTLIYNAATTLNFTLSPKTASDYAQVPSSLNFSPITVLNTNSQLLQLGAVGFLGSYLHNSLFIAHRNDIDSQTPNAEIIRKLDLINNSWSSTEFLISDFTTKRLHIIDNELISIGGSFINFYDLNAFSDPITSENYTTNAYPAFSRFGSFQVNNNLYLVGGDFVAENSDRIYKFNDTFNTVEITATMPSNKTWAQSEVVDNKAYVFSGQQLLNDSTPETLSYIYDIDTNDFTPFDLPYSLFTSYTAKYENLIFVAGDIRTDTNNDGILDQSQPALGVYNTEDNTYTDIQTNLGPVNGIPYTIFEMTILNDTLYIIYGNNLDSSTTEYLIMEASLL